MSAITKVNANEIIKEIEAYANEAELVWKGSLKPDDCAVRSVSTDSLSKYELLKEMKAFVDQAEESDRYNYYVYAVPTSGGNGTFYFLSK